MRFAIGLLAALALLRSHAALGGYVIHPSPNDPSPPAVVAIDEQWILDRFGQAWNSGGWSREPQFDPPIPLAELMFWEPYNCVSFSGEVFVGGAVGWSSAGYPPSVSGISDAIPTRDELRTIPNPSHDPCRITFTLPTAGHVSVRIFDATGRLVRTVLEGELPAGQAAVEWDGKGNRGEAMAAGIYFSRVETAQGAIAGRIVIAR